MAAPIQNLAIERGDTQSLTLTVTWPIGTIDSNLHNYKIYYTAKATPLVSDANAVFQLVTGGLGITVTSNTTADIQIPATATLPIVCPPPSYTTVMYYDVEIIGTDFKPHTVVQGALTVQADITSAVT